MPRLVDNFKSGDLLYGLESARESRRKALQSRLGLYTGITIDQYNNVILTQLLDIFTHEYDSTKFDEVKDWINGGTFKLTRLDKDEALKHLNAITEAPDKISIRRNEPAKKDKKSDIDLEERKKRRTCKARLAHPTTNIHFLLDDINLADTFDKTKLSAPKSRGMTKSNHYDSFTSSELRFVFKNFDVLTASKDHLRFYYNDKEVDLFAWVSKHDKHTKEILLRWAEQEHKEGKISDIILHRIHQAIAQPNFQPVLSQARSPEREKSDFNKRHSPFSSPIHRQTQPLAPISPTQLGKRSPNKRSSPNTTPLHSEPSLKQRKLGKTEEGEENIENVFPQKQQAKVGLFSPQSSPTNNNSDNPIPPGITRAKRKLF